MPKKGVCPKCHASAMKVTRYEPCKSCGKSDFEKWKCKKCEHKFTRNVPCRCIKRHDNAYRQ